MATHIALNDATGGGTSGAIELAPTKYLAVQGAPVLAAESELSSRVQVLPVLRVPAPGIDGTAAHRPWYDARGWFRKPLPGTWAYTWLLAYETIGIIYGDIGTSPLYAFTSLYPNGPPSPDQVIGGLSCMIWTLLLVVVVKYVGFVLLADDHGEGGTFALYSMLTRALRTKAVDPKRYIIYNRILAIMAIIGVSAVMSDGILTPAISVLSAVGGITVAAPDFSPAAVTGVSALILFLLMMGQRFGTAKVAFTFSPIIIIWFIAIVSIGLYYIAQAPYILAAFSPHYAFIFFIENGYFGFVQLGAIVLVVTGTEALFADLGHFNAAAVRLSALCFVIPSLLIAYCGQGAALALNYNALVAAGWVPGSANFPPNANVVIANTFFNMVPPSLLIPYVIIATLAAIIASQAMISASFSLIHQAMRLNMFPRVTVIHTDSQQYGQIYIPEVNYSLMVGILAVVAVAQNSNALTYAYGVTVTTVFVLTTILYTIAIVVRFHRHWFWALLFFCVYMVIDVSFLAANLLKFTTGAWFPVVICIALSSIMMVWRWGRLRMIERQLAMATSESTAFKTAPDLGNNDDPASDSPPVVTVISMDGGGDGSAADGNDDRTLQVLPGKTMICYTSQTDAVPANYAMFVRQLPVRAENVIFVTIMGVNVPRVSENITVNPVPNVRNVWRALITHGYAESPPDATKVAMRLIWKLNLAGAEERHGGTAVSDEDTLALVAPTFLLGSDSVEPEAGSNLWHRFLVSWFRYLLRLSRPATVGFKIPPTMQLEIGVRVEI